jgi:UTP--glucose-1-phosphate uridylyltransferase
MTLVDRPLIQYAIDEARAAGIKEFIFVTSRGKVRAGGLLRPLAGAGKRAAQEGQDRASRRSEDHQHGVGAIAYIRQHKALGLGHAVWCARRLLSNEPFAVILPDDVIAAETPCLQQMVEAHAEIGGNMVAAMEVPDDKTNAYGILDVKEDMGSVVSVKGMVEKPARRDCAVEPRRHRTLHP